MFFFCYNLLFKSFYDIICRINGGFIMNICVKVAEASNRFERCNTDLKRKYLIKNIETINTIMKHAPGYCGSFGTGYPFYVLNSKLEGMLPIIEEQIRYNNELYNETKESSYWPCEGCLNTIGSSMPDLKQICKPCPKVSDTLKPRKVINRLPDVDMWMICEDGKIEEAKNRLCKLFEEFDMHTSDVDPIASINDLNEIVAELTSGKMPKKYLPLDIHIIEYSKFSRLLDEISFTLINAVKTDQIPYLPIHPISLRKTWQYDDMAYNFVLDYLLSLTPFNWEDTLNRKFALSKSFISSKLSDDDFKKLLSLVAPDSVKRRFETPQLQKRYERRFESWIKE